MKTILLMYWHGIGDLICLTPQLRELHKQRWTIDLICRQPVIKAKLLASCPYIRKIIPLPYVAGGPHSDGASGPKKRQQCMELYNGLIQDYDTALEFDRSPDRNRRGGKIFRNNEICGFTESIDLQLEVFISDRAERIARSYIKKHYPNGYIFRHTDIDAHRVHSWNATSWMKQHLPNMPIFNTGVGKMHDMMFTDINIAFVLAREAQHRVLSSSVFVHACDAMNVSIDVVNYGIPNKHAWPLDPDKIKIIRGVK